MKRLVRKWSKVVCVAVLATSPTLLGAAHSAEGISWSSWSDRLFDRAAKEHKFILLNLVRGGCEDCRDMDVDTYRDERVQGLIAKQYIPVRVDINARPDLANRYWNYQLPGIVIFNSNGNEIIRQQGYVPAKGMAATLQAVIDDPSPGPSIKPEPLIQYSSSPSMAPSLLKELQTSFASQYDIPAQGWAFAVQYLDRELVEYGLSDKSRGGTVDSNNLHLAIARSRQLIDPVWGGVYESLVVPVTEKSSSQFLRVQISGRLDTTGDSWNTPHYEKTAFAQAEAMEAFSAAYRRWHDPNDLRAALNVASYVNRWLQNGDGAFYTAQAGYVDGSSNSETFFSKDDHGRRAIGVPSVDKGIYARENGQMIRAFCFLYLATNDRHFLEEAERSAQWMLEHRALRGGGFSHGDHDTGGPFLVDSVEVARGFLALYDATHDDVWLRRAQAALDFIAKTFLHPDMSGAFASGSATDPLYKPHANREENAGLISFIADLSERSGRREHPEIAISVMRFLVTKEIATANFTAPVLLANSRYIDFVKKGAVAK